jgi:DNA anti-recombination protein RmuC
MGMSPEEFAAASAQTKERMAARRQARRAEFGAALNTGSQKTLAQLDEERAAQLAAFNPNYTRRG